MQKALLISGDRKIPVSLVKGTEQLHEKIFQQAGCQEADTIIPKISCYVAPEVKSQRLNILQRLATIVRPGPGPEEEKERTDALRSLELMPVRNLVESTDGVEAHQLVRRKGEWLGSEAASAFDVLPGDLRAEADLHLQAANWMQRAAEGRRRPLHGRIEVAKELRAEIEAHLLKTEGKTLLGFDWGHGGERVLLLVEVEKQEDEEAYTLRFFNSSLQLAGLFPREALPTLEKGTLPGVAEALVGAVLGRKESACCALEYTNVPEYWLRIILRPLLLAQTAEISSAAAEAEMIATMQKALKGDASALKGLGAASPTQLKSILGNAIRASTAPVRAQHLGLQGVMQSESLALTQQIAGFMQRGMSKGFMRVMKQASGQMLDGFDLSDLLTAGRGPGWHTVEGIFRTLDEVDGVDRTYLGTSRTIDEEKPFHKVLGIYDRVLHKPVARLRKLRQMLARTRELMLEKTRIAGDVQFRGIIWDEINRIETFVDKHKMSLFAENSAENLIAVAQELGEMRQVLEGVREAASATIADRVALGQNRFHGVVRLPETITRPVPMKGKGLGKPDALHSISPFSLDVLKNEWVPLIEGLAKANRHEELREVCLEMVLQLPRPYESDIWKEADAEDAVNTLREHLTAGLYHRMAAVAENNLLDWAPYPDERTAMLRLWMVMDVLVRREGSSAARWMQNRKLDATALRQLMEKDFYLDQGGCDDLLRKDLNYLENIQGADLNLDGEPNLNGWQGDLTKEVIEAAGGSEEICKNHLNLLLQTKLNIDNAAIDARYRSKAEYDERPISDYQAQIDDDKRGVRQDVARRAVWVVDGLQKFWPQGLLGLRDHQIHTMVLNNPTAVVNIGTLSAGAGAAAQGVKNMDRFIKGGKKMFKHAMNDDEDALEKSAKELEREAAGVVFRSRASSLKNPKPSACRVRHTFNAVVEYTVMVEPIGLSLTHLSMHYLYRGSFKNGKEPGSSEFYGASLSQERGGRDMLALVKEGGEHLGLTKAISTELLLDRNRGEFRNFSDEAFKLGEYDPSVRAMHVMFGDLGARLEFLKKPELQRDLEATLFRPGVIEWLLSDSVRRQAFVDLINDAMASADFSKDHATGLFLAQISYRAKGRTGVKGLPDYEQYIQAKLGAAASEELAAVKGLVYQHLLYLRIHGPQDALDPAELITAYSGFKAHRPRAEFREPQLYDKIDRWMHANLSRWRDQGLDFTEALDKALEELVPGATKEGEWAAIGDLPQYGCRIKDGARTCEMQIDLSNGLFSIDGTVQTLVSQSVVEISEDYRTLLGPRRLRSRLAVLDDREVYEIDHQGKWQVHYILNEDAEPEVVLLRKFQHQGQEIFFQYVADPVEELAELPAGVFHLHAFVDPKQRENYLFVDSKFKIHYSARRRSDVLENFIDWTGQQQRLLLNLSVQGELPRALGALEHSAHIRANKDEIFLDRLGLHFQREGDRFVCPRYRGYVMRENEQLDLFGDGSHFGVLLTKESDPRQRLYVVHPQMLLPNENGNKPKGARIAVIDRDPKNLEGGRVIAFQVTQDGELASKDPEANLWLSYLYMAKGRPAKAAYLLHRAMTDGKRSAFFEQVATWMHSWEEHSVGGISVQLQLAVGMFRKNPAQVGQGGICGVASGRFIQRVLNYRRLLRRPDLQSPIVLSRDDQRTLGYLLSSSMSAMGETAINFVATFPGNWRLVKGGHPTFRLGDNEQVVRVAVDASTFLIQSQRDANEMSATIDEIQHLIPRSSDDWGREFPRIYRRIAELPTDSPELKEWMFLLRCGSGSEFGERMLRRLLYKAAYLRVVEDRKLSDLPPAPTRGRAAGSGFFFGLFPWHEGQTSEMRSWVEDLDAIKLPASEEIEGDELMGDLPAWWEKRNDLFRGVHSEDSVNVLGDWLQKIPANSPLVKLFFDEEKVKQLMQDIATIQNLNVELASAARQTGQLIADDVAGFEDRVRGPEGTMSLFPEFVNRTVEASAVGVRTLWRGWSLASQFGLGVTSVPGIAVDLLWHKKPVETVALERGQRAAHSVYSQRLEHALTFSELKSLFQELLTGQLDWKNEKLQGAAADAVQAVLSDALAERLNLFGLGVSDLMELQEIIKNFDQGKLERDFGEEAFSPARLMSLGVKTMMGGEDPIEAGRRALGSVVDMIAGPVVTALQRKRELASVEAELEKRQAAGLPQPKTYNATTTGKLFGDDDADFRRSLTNAVQGEDQDLDSRVWQGFEEKLFDEGRYPAAHHKALAGEIKKGFSEVWKEKKRSDCQADTGQLKGLVEARLEQIAQRRAHLEKKLRVRPAVPAGVPTEVYERKECVPVATILHLWEVDRLDQLHEVYGVPQGSVDSKDVEALDLAIIAEQELSNWAKLIADIEATVDPRQHASRLRALVGLIQQPHYYRAGAEAHQRRVLATEREELFVLRREQLEISNSMIEKPTRASQDRLGIGKSTVITKLVLASLADGYHLPALIATSEDEGQALLREDRTTRARHGCPILHFKFDQTTRVSVAALEELEIKIKRTALEKGEMVTTKESLLLFRDKYEEQWYFRDLAEKRLEKAQGADEKARAKGELDDIDQRIDVWGRCLGALREHVRALADEGDKILDPRDMVNLALQEMESLDPVQQKMGALIPQLIVEHMPEVGLLDNQQAATLRDPADLLKVRVAVAKRLLSGWNIAHSDQMIDYLTGRGYDQGLNALQERLKGRQDWKEIAIAREFLAQAAPVLANEGNVDCGRMPDSDDVGPYKGAQRPLVGSSIADPFEWTFCLVCDYLREGVEPRQLSRLVDELRVRKFRAQRRNEPDVLVAEFERDVAPLESLKPENFDAICQKVNANWKTKLGFCRQFVLPSLEYYNKQIRGKSAQVPGMCKSLCLFSGTMSLWRAFADSIDTSNAADYKIDGLAYHHFIRFATQKGGIDYIGGNKIDDVFASCRGSDGLGDAGATLKAYTIDEIIEWAIANPDVYKPGIKHFIYIDPVTDEWMVRDIGSSEAQRYGDRHGIKLEEAFVYYDDLSTRAKDLRKLFNCKLTITIGDRSRLTKHAQAQARNRHLDDWEQTLQYRLASHLDFGPVDEDLAYKVGSDLLCREADYQVPQNFKGEADKFHGYLEDAFYLARQEITERSDRKVLAPLHQKLVIKTTSPGLNTREGVDELGRVTERGDAHACLEQIRKQELSRIYDTVLDIWQLCHPGQPRPAQGDIRVHLIELCGGGKLTAEAAQALGTHLCGAAEKVVGHTLLEKEHLPAGEMSLPREGANTEVNVMQMQMQLELEEVQKAEVKNVVVEDRYEDWRFYSLDNLWNSLERPRLFVPLSKAKLDFTQEGYLSKNLGLPSNVTEGAWDNFWGPGMLPTKYILVMRRGNEWRDIAISHAELGPALQLIGTHDRDSDDDDLEVNVGIKGFLLRTDCRAGLLAGATERVSNNTIQALRGGESARNANDTPEIQQLRRIRAKWTLLSGDIDLFTREDEEAFKGLFSNGHGLDKKKVLEARKLWNFIIEQVHPANLPKRDGCPVEKAFEELIGESSLR